MGYPSLCRILFCGKRGIRTPGASQLNGFQDRRNRPLCHLSGGKSSTLFSFYQIPAGNSPPPSGRAAIAPAALKTAARRAGDTVRKPGICGGLPTGRPHVADTATFAAFFAPAVGTMRNPSVRAGLPTGRPHVADTATFAAFFAPGSRHDAKPLHPRRFCRRAGGLRNRKDAGTAYFRKIY